MHSTDCSDYSVAADRNSLKILLCMHPLLTQKRHPSRDPSARGLLDVASAAPQGCFLVWSWAERYLFCRLSLKAIGEKHERSALVFQIQILQLL